MRRSIVWLVILLSFASHAQVKQGKAHLDSLLGEMAKQPTDTASVTLLNEIANASYLSEPDTGLLYAQKALTLAREIGWRRGEAFALNNAGNAYHQKAAFPQALDNYYRALHINEDLANRQAIGMVSGNIGTVFYDQKAYDKALEYFFKGLMAAQQSGDKAGELLADGNIGNVYYEQGRNADALEFTQKAFSIATELKDRRGAINQMSNIGNVYASMGNKREALNWYSRALNIGKEDGDLQVIAVNEGNIGETYLDIAKDSAALPAARSANIKSAIAYLEAGVAGARKIAYTQAVLEFLQPLSAAYAMQGDYQRALAFYQQYTALKDSTFSLENNEKIAHLETARELALKDKDIQIYKLAVAKKRNERWGFIAGIGLLLCIMAMLFRSFRRQRHSNHLLSKEKKRSDDLLLNILPAEVADELKDNGTSVARQYDEVSVLFTDFVNFTGAAEHLSPQALIQELNEYFTAFDAIIERNGLEKIKTIGDAYMAVCGLPVSDPLHAKKTVQAALEIRDFIEVRKQGANAFGIRLGINSGAVIAGIVGVKKFAYDIWGDTVNTAARMEQHSEPGAINISHITYELVKDDYRCTYRGRIAAKNKGEVEMYFVEAAMKA